MNSIRFQETGYLYYDGEVHKAFFYDHDYIQRIYKTDKNGDGIEIWNMQDTDSKHPHELERNTAITCGRNSDNKEPLTTVRIDLENHTARYNPFGKLYRFTQIPNMAYGVHWLYRANREIGVLRDLYFIQDKNEGLWVTNDFQFYKQIRIKYNGETKDPRIIGLSKDSIVCRTNFDSKPCIAICHFDDIVIYKNYGLTSTSCFLCENPILLYLDNLKAEYNVTGICDINSYNSWSMSYNNEVGEYSENRICVPVYVDSIYCGVLGIDTEMGDVLYCTRTGRNSGNYIPHSLLTQNNYVTYIDTNITATTRYAGSVRNVNTETGEITTSYNFGSIPEFGSTHPSIDISNCIELGKTRYYFIHGSQSYDYDYIITSLNGLARYRKAKPSESQCYATILIPIYDCEGELINKHYVRVYDICNGLYNRTGPDTTSGGCSYPGMFYQNSSAMYLYVPDCAVVYTSMGFYEEDGITPLTIRAIGYFATTNIMEMDETNTFFCATNYIES